MGGTITVRGTAIRTTDLLLLTQWLSPAFPLSGYAYSHGLEAAMAAGRVRDAEGVRRWAASVLERGAGALDVWAIRAVMGGAEPEGVAEVIRARAGCAQRWEETRAMGAAFAATRRAMGQGDDPAAPLPVALGLAARGMDGEAVAVLYLQALAGQVIGAAARFLPLGQAEAQAVQAALHPLILRVAADARAEPPGTGALLAELDAMAHETLQPRIFRT
jgi:urease accessory protein